jgi:hypothetical protein
MQTILEKEHTQNLADYVVGKISEMTQKMDCFSQSIPVKAVCPEPPSGEIFNEVQKDEEEVDTTDSNAKEVSITPPVILHNVFFEPSQQKQLKTNPPFISFYNLNVNHSPDPQIVPIINHFPLPPQFQTMFYNPATNLHYWYDGQLIPDPRHPY